MTTNSNLLSAVCRVMTDVKRLGKADNNTFAKYKFTSADDYRDHLRPLMAMAGLSITASETHFEIVPLKTSKGDDRSVAWFTFEITLKHESGEVEPPDTTSVMLDFTGAQTTGAAKTYAVKEWLKTRFMASSGDVAEDADTHAPNEYTGAVAKKASLASRKPEFEQLHAELLSCKTRDALLEWKAMRKREINSLPEQWLEALGDRYEQHRDSLPFNANVDAFGLAPLEARQ